MQKSLIIVSVFISFITILLLIAFFAYGLFPMSTNENGFDEIIIDFSQIHLLKWQDVADTPDILYYDVVNGENYIVAYYDLNYNSQRGLSYLRPTLAVVYSSDELNINTRNFTAMSTYIYENISITLDKADVVSAFLLPPALNPNLYSYDDPFYVTRYLSENGHFPYFYSVSSLDFSIVVQNTNEGSFHYTIYPIGNGNLYVTFNSRNFIGGSISNIAYIFEFEQYPRFEIEETGNFVQDIFYFIKGLYNFSIQAVEYIFLFFSSIFFSINPLYYLR